MSEHYPSVPSYQSPEWKALRETHLKKHPHCEYCLQLGKIVFGRVVDHKIPHRGDIRLWRDPNNLRTLCDVHGNATKSKEELRGQEVGCSITGWPNGDGHFWNGGDKKEPQKTDNQKLGAVKRKLRRR